MSSNPVTAASRRCPFFCFRPCKTGTEVFFFTSRHPFLFFRPCKTGTEFFFFTSHKDFLCFLNSAALTRSGFDQIPRLCALARATQRSSSDLLPQYSAPPPSYISAKPRLASSIDMSTPPMWRKRDSVRNGRRISSTLQTARRY